MPWRVTSKLAGRSRNPPPREAAYEWIAAELRRFAYPRLSNADKGLLRRYLGKVTGLSRIQITRLIAQFRERGRIRERRGPPLKPFARRYTPSDVRLLAEVDTLHTPLSGPATRKLCERAYRVFGDARYERLAVLSNGHLYKLPRQLPRRKRTGIRRAPTSDLRATSRILPLDSSHNATMSSFPCLPTVLA